MSKKPSKLNPILAFYGFNIGASIQVWLYANDAGAGFACFWIIMALRETLEYAFTKCIQDFAVVVLQMVQDATKSRTVTHEHSVKHEVIHKTEGEEWQEG